jgi:hypothetical protein
VTLWVRWAKEGKTIPVYILLQVIKIKLFLLMNFLKFLFKFDIFRAARLSLPIILHIMRSLSSTTQIYISYVVCLITASLCCSWYPLHCLEMNLGTGSVTSSRIWNLGWCRSSLNIVGYRGTLFCKVKKKISTMKFGDIEKMKSLFCM